MKKKSAAKIIELLLAHGADPLLVHNDQAERKHAVEAAGAVWGAPPRQTSKLVY